MGSAEFCSSRIPRWSSAEAEQDRLALDLASVLGARSAGVALLAGGVEQVGALPHLERAHRPPAQQAGCARTARVMRRRGGRHLAGRHGAVESEGAGLSGHGAGSQDAQGQHSDQQRRKQRVGSHLR